MRVRILSAQIENFRNVSYGEINFPHSEDPFTLQSDVLGIYGQNGSGKTTFIYVLEILQCLLSGQPLRDEINDGITCGANEAKLCFEFSVEDKLGIRFRAVYSAQLGQDYLNETMKASVFQNGAWSRLNDILASNSSDTEHTVRPSTMLNKLFSKSTKVLNELRVAKILCAKEHRSLLFSNELLRLMRQGSGDTIWLSMFSALRHYAITDFFVINNHNTGLISMDAALPLNFRTSSALGRFALPLDKPIVLPEDIHEVVHQVIDTINYVLREIIPGMEIGIKDLGTELMEDGNTGIRIQLVRNHKNPDTGKSTSLPLKYESEGIKKIISILHLFISAYNNPGITLAVDELDSGIYEYLLGELLHIMQNSGKGQLLFTSHNLRPLEMLNCNSIIFTTTNPKNRYVRMSSIRNSNNLRLRYYRDITLGRDSGEELYEETNSIEIAHAMRKIGIISRKQAGDD